MSVSCGKTLVIGLTAIGDVEDDGLVRLFFELNGQPRIIAVADRSATGNRLARPVAEEGNEGHIPAPMPGLVVGVDVKQGQRVAAGERLVTLEAMKMETSIAAPFDGTIAEILVKPGDLVEAKHLIVRIER